MLSRKLIKKQRGRRGLTLIAIAGLLVSAMGISGSVLAVHDHQFQLDGETTTTGFSLPAPGTQSKDWNSLFNANGSNTSGAFDPTPGNDKFTHGAFTRDFGVRVSAQDTCSLTNTTSITFCTKDSTTFATGSKDTLNIGGWQCNRDNNVNSKIDIMNAYAAAYTGPTGDRIIYFGMEKNKDVGTNNVGFWFLQGNANCVSPGGAVTFTGTHSPGDVLVVSEFSNGGGVSNITAYKWVGGANPLVLFGQGGDCKTTSTGSDTLCATTNAVGGSAWNETVTTKWRTADATIGVGDKVVSPNFFEGGINLTKAFLNSGTPVPSCFNTFIGNTRSSTSTTATLFDFARGTLGQCNVGLTTTPSTTSTTLAATSAVTDTANLVGQSGSGGTAPSPTGTVDFFLCTPSQLDANQLCSVGGTAVTGNPVAVVVGTAPNSSATSGNVRSLITVSGKYCFRAVYTAAANDPNYSGSTAETSNLAGECFTVTGTASLSTAQNWLPNDSATITADAAFSGNLTFNLYHSADCTGTAEYTEGPTAVSGPAAGATFTTTNTTYKVSLANANTGNWSWGVTYDDATLTDPAASCEPATVTIVAGG